MWQQYCLCALGVLAILIGGCGKSDTPSQSSAAPAQMNISGPQAVVLGPDNIQAEIAKAGTSVELGKLDLSSAGLPLTMDAPKDAKATPDHSGGVQVTADDHFAIRIQLGKRSFDRKRQQLARQKILVNDKDLVLAESVLLLDVRGEFARHVVVGQQDYCVENLAPLLGLQVNHSQADCLLMLKCIGTLAAKAPLPADPLAALRQLGAKVEETGGQATGLVLDHHQTSDATLELVAKLPGLERLDLHQCPITDEGLAHLRGLTGLKELNLSDCDLTDAGLSSLAALTNLETLNLASSFGDSPRIEGFGLASLAGLTKLRVLVLDKNLIDDAGLPHLKELKGLKELYLEQTRVSGPGLASLKELTGLTLLSLKEAAKITDDGLAGLQDVSSLEILNLQGTLVRGSGLKNLYGLKKLHTLNLSNTPMSDVELPKLAGLMALKQLILEGTEVSDTGLEYLQAVKSLKQVSLAQTKATKTGADKLKAALPGVEVTLE